MANNYKKPRIKGRAPWMSTEDLYQEFFRNREKYPSLAKFYQRYYLQARYSNEPEKLERKRKMEADRTFYRTVYGFKERREEDIRKQTEMMMKEKAKEDAKAKTKLELKDYAIGVEGYLEDFKMIREALRYALKRTHILIQEELRKTLEAQEKGVVYVPKAIALTPGELSQIHAYRQFYQSMRTSMKLPIQYTVNYEEQDTQDSVGGLLRTIASYKKAGGKFDEKSDEEIKRIDVEFSRG